MKKIILSTVLLSLLSLISCDDNKIEVTVANATGFDLGMKVVELPASPILNQLKTPGFRITNDKGQEIPSQLTEDSLIIFSCSVASGNKSKFYITPSDSILHYEPKVWGKFYPKRRDDLSYENELVGFRIYGPGTQQAQERAYGYDLFFKYPTEELIVPQLYAPETDDAVWAKVDSLKTIDNNLAAEYINSFSYHIDHGKGMDCYAVGPTLGAGVAAILENDSIYYPWCYEVAKILDNGPIRFSALLKFKPVDKAAQENVIEYRKITLDSYSYLNSCQVWFDGLKNSVDMVMGFPLRDDSAPVALADMGIVAYADPTQGPDNGKALLGIKKSEKADTTFIKDNHILLSYKLNPTDTLKYKWGFTWSKTEISTMEEWVDYLKTADLKYAVTIK